MAEIITLGEIVVEIMATERGQTFLRPGLFAGPYPSGAPAIFADQAARVGAATLMIGRVGDDDFGTLALDRLRSSGVDVAAVRRTAGATTGVAFVTYGEDGGRDFIFTIAQSASAALDAGDLDPGHFRGCRYLHVMGSSLFNRDVAGAVLRGVELARAAGARLSVDPNVRKELLGDPEIERTLREIVEASDVLLPSADDLAYLYPGVTEDEAAAGLRDGGRRIVVLKKGAAGCVAHEDGRRVALPAHAVTEVDPTGAGDGFGGTFVAGLVLGMTTERALRLANAAGALAVQKRGPMEGNATLAEIEAFLATGR